MSKHVKACQSLSKLDLLIIFSRCVMSALKRYFETHLALKADQMRRAQEVSVSSHFSRNKAIRLSGWDFLNKKISHSLRFSLMIENWRKKGQSVSFSQKLSNLKNFNSWIMKLTKTSILPNCQEPNGFFGWLTLHLQLLSF